MAGVMKEVLGWLKLGVLGGIAGGIVAFALSFILPSVLALAGGLASVVSLVIALVLLVLGYSLIPNNQRSILDKVPSVAILFVSITIVGTLVGMFFPQVSGFILDVNAPTIEGFVFVLAYISLGLAALNRFAPKMLKP